MIKKIEIRQVKEKQLLIEEMRKTPVIEIVCKKNSVSRATYYRWQQEDKEFKRQSRDAIDYGIEFINDMSESQLITLNKEKKMPAIAMWLKHNHKRYGSKGREYIPIASIEDLSPEENKMVLDALALASGKSYERKPNTRVSRKNLGE